jgi:hypothetical protein
MDGEEHAATELANQAQVASSTASAHLKALSEGGLVTVHATGRQRRYRLSGPPVARALEALGRIAPPWEVSSLRESTARERLARARTCYDHLAGRLGVSIADALIKRGALLAEDGNYVVTGLGVEQLSSIGIEVEDLRKTKRALVLACSDWTERRLHLGGSLASELRKSFLDSEWIRTSRGSRAVTITEAGLSAFRRYLGLELGQ